MRGGGNSSHIENVIMIPHKLPDVGGVNDVIASKQVYGDSLCLEKLENRTRIRGDVIAAKPNYKKYQKAVLGSSGSVNNTVNTVHSREMTPSVRQTKNNASPKGNSSSVKGTPENPIVIRSPSPQRSQWVDDYSGREVDNFARYSTQRKRQIVDEDDGRSIESLLGIPSPSKPQSKRKKISSPAAVKDTSRKRNIILSGEHDRMHDLRPSPQIATPSIMNDRSVRSVMSDVAALVHNETSRSHKQRNSAKSTSNRCSYRSRGHDHRRHRDDALVRLRKERVNQMYRQYQPYLLMGMMGVQVTLGWMGLDMACYVNEQKVMLVEYYALLKEVCEESVPSVEDMRKSKESGNNTSISPLNRLLMSIMGNTVVFVFGKFLGLSGIFSMLADIGNTNKTNPPGAIGREEDDDNDFYDDGYDDDLQPTRATR
ncbi:hypothetical protein F8203_gp066 [Heliothis virescens ascovirus 3f]|uniref:Uncharacterized protein n=1 Tax=Heliothis virescens ascovirus 3f TaxID=328614 RepID=A0A171PVF6_9VIRU|nr:hypothetical protein F8203_gp066 [Heliothis virescens ascovirus 3f]AJP09032.1 hypothetical protein [Heliothis virescens ascovirus 3f]